MKIELKVDIWKGTKDEIIDKIDWITTPILGILIIQEILVFFNFNWILLGLNSLLIFIIFLIHQSILKYKKEKGGKIDKKQEE